MCIRDRVLAYSKTRPVRDGLKQQKNAKAKAAYRPVSYTHLSKLLALYLPYVVIGLVATNLGEAWRLAVGKELGDKIVSLMDTLPAVFSNPLPSLHPFDLFIGLCCGAGMRLAVYLKGKNAKKYRHGMEYGSARWGGPKDIEPFMAPKFEDNIILTKTERLMMSNRPPDVYKRQHLYRAGSAGFTGLCR